MPLDADDARRLALALPGAVEQPYHGVPSFRVAGKVFANLPDPEHAHVLLEEDEIRAAATLLPRACDEVRWGRQLGALRVTLARIEERDLERLLRDAWRRRAPKKLQRGDA